MKKPWLRRTHDDFSDEVQSHIDLETDRLMAEGMSADDAHAAAARAFGSVAIVKERFYEQSRWVWLDQLSQDLRYAWRGLRQSPSFALTTIGTLAVGIGLLTVAFTVFDAYFLRTFAIRDPHGLHQIVWHSRDSGGTGFRWRDYDELSRRGDLFSAIIGEHTRFVSSQGRPLAMAVVSYNYFEALAPAILMGRGLGADDANGAGDPVVLSHPAWMRLFAGDASVLGRQLDLNGHAFTIVGVVGPAFIGLGDQPRDVFVAATPLWTTRRGAASDARETEIFVRLRPGVGIAQAETGLRPFLERVVESPQNVRAEVRPQPSPNPLTMDLIVLLGPIVAAFVLVLVTACANVSNVMLARAIARHREMAVRLSMGANRGRVVRQLLTEGLLIAVIAGGTGLLLAAASLRLATRALFATLPPSVTPLIRLVPMPFDSRVFVFALAVSAATTVIFALLPALQTSRISLTDALRGQGGAARRGSRLRNALVVAQVAVALALVIVAVTLANNGGRIGASDLGFETAGVLSVNVRGDQDELARPLADALAADPRVSSVAVTSGNPLFNQYRIILTTAGRAQALPMKCTFVSPEFFPILRIPIASGRGFRDDEARAAARVAIVSTATASALWSGEDPIGKTIAIERAKGRPVDELPEYDSVVVVGTVRDMVTGMMVTGRDRGHIYLPMSSNDVHASAILVGGRADRDLNPEAMQEIFRRVAPDPQIFEILPLSEMRDLQMYPLLAMSSVALLLGGIALTLSMSGLYGVLTYALSQRRKEIGIRMALGATTRAVVGMVMRQSLRLGGFGAAIGAGVTFAILKILSSVVTLHEISVLDLGAFAAALVMVIAATLLAAYGPAHRATRVEPSETLRCDA